MLCFQPLELSEFNGDSGGYRVEYQSEFDSAPRNATVTNPLSRFFILGNLTAYARYTVKVISRNSRYESVPSDAVSARTIEYGKSILGYLLYVVLVMKIEDMCTQVEENFDWK